MKQRNSTQLSLSGWQKLRAPLPPIHSNDVRSSALWISRLLLLTLFSFMTSCQSPSTQNTKALSEVPSEADLKNATTLKEGDVVSVSFETMTNLNSTHKLTIDGLITMPLVGKIKALGKTPSELEANIEALYEPKLQAKETVIVRLMSSTAVIYVTGAVVRPSKVPLERPMTVLEAVIEVGGPDPNRAKLTEVLVLRLDNGRRVRHVLNLKNMLNGKEPSLFYLEPFDVIYVPEKAFNF